MRLLRPFCWFCITLLSLPASASLLDDAISLDYYYRWQQFMQADHLLDELSLVREVDRFVNLASYRSDNERFSMEDVWSAPDEFFSQAEGDCEDFAIAKYFTLIALGLPMARLQLVYGKLVDTDTEHMVLRYRPADGQDALLLDNMTAGPTPEHIRKDFKPVYQFDQKNVWLISKGVPIQAGKLKSPQWQRILQRWQPEWLALN